MKITIESGSTRLTVEVDDAGIRLNPSTVVPQPTDQELLDAWRKVQAASQALGLDRGESSGASEDPAVGGHTGYIEDPLDIDPDQTLADERAFQVEEAANAAALLRQMKPEPSP